MSLILSSLLFSILALLPQGVEEGIERTQAWLYVDRGEGVEVVKDSLAGLKFSLDDTILSDSLQTLTISLCNGSKETFAPLSMGVHLPLDTYMEAYPSWLDKWSPIYLYCASDHFLGYAQTPSGRLKGIFSPDPIACWTLDYNLGYPDPLWFYGHRIEGIRLDLLHDGPLPEHHPHGLSSLAPGQSLQWKIYLVDLPALQEYPAFARKYTRAPIFDAPKTCYTEGEEVCVQLYAHRPKIEVNSPSGKRVKASLKRVGQELWKVSFRSDCQGDYTVEALDCGRFASCLITTHRPWEELVGIAREAARDCPQKPTSHVESWYGFFSAFLASRTVPESGLDSLLDARFDYILSRLYTPECTPRYFASRIQNTSGTISMLVDRWKAYRRPEDLQRAAKMADWLIDFAQAESGAYMNGGTKYTSVIYPAKSMLELSLAEKEASQGADEALQEASQRHFSSAKAAVMELVRSRGDFQTEGEQTFEDGMVSCSALQMGFLALALDEQDPLRDTLTGEMLSLLSQHDCLTQLYVPDGRRRGGTLRFWESQYDVLMLPDMISSPHGWSAWRAYATYYAYLLTGQEKWLLESWNAAGAFADLISPEGKLRWAFVVDPYVQARQTRKPVPGFSSDSLSFGNPHPDVLGTRPQTVGEQYIDMVSSYQGINTQDNDVHEVFRFIGEAFLENAFVVRRSDGTLSCYNCRLEGGELIPDGKSIKRFHFNLSAPKDFHLGGKTLHLPEGMTWKSI